MQTSVIIPAYNDSDRLKLCLDALAKQTVPQDQYEVIVIDNGSDYPPRELVESYSFCRFTEESKPGSYAARNKGLELAQGEIIAFTDADCIPEPNWLEEGIKAVSVEGFDGQIGGAIELFAKDPENPNKVELFDMIFGLKQEKHVSHWHFAATANMFTLRSIIDEVGPFNDKIMSGGDTQWGTNLHSLGRTVLYEPKAIIKHPARNDYEGIIIQSKRHYGGRHDQFIHNRKSRSFGWILKRVYLHARPPFGAYQEAYQFLKENGYGWKETMSVWKIITHNYLIKHVTFIKLFFTSKRERR